MIIKHIEKLSINALKKLCSQHPSPEILEALRNDSRKGAAQLARQLERKLETQRKIRERLEALVVEDRKLLNDEGAVSIIGVDEVGRGPLAGPVVACALLQDIKLFNLIYQQALHLNDSKQMTEKERNEIYWTIFHNHPYYAFGVVSNTEIDKINIKHATDLAIKKALDSLFSVIREQALSLGEYVIAVDGNTSPRNFSRCRAVSGGDAKLAVIASASVMAKVYRDAMMMEYEKMYPGYNFAGHKGYGTQEHLQALRHKGPTPIHRESFIRSYI